MIMGVIPPRIRSTDENVSDPEEYDAMILACGEAGKSIAWSLAAEGKHSSDIVRSSKRVVNSGCHPSPYADRNHVLEIAESGNRDVFAPLLGACWPTAPPGQSRFPSWGAIVSRKQANPTGLAHHFASLQLCNPPMVFA